MPVAIFLLLPSFGKWLACARVCSCAIDAMCIPRGVVLSDYVHRLLHYNLCFISPFIVPVGMAPSRYFTHCHRRRMAASSSSWSSSSVQHDGHNVYAGCNVLSKYAQCPSLPDHQEKGGARRAHISVIWLVDRWVTSQRYYA